MPSRDLIDQPHGRPRSRHGLTFSAALAACLLLTPAARAQEPADVDRARELTHEAIALAEAGRHAEALDRANQAEALYHAPIHLRIIAEALEGLGRLAEAASTYERLVAEPLSASVPQVFRDAQDAGRARLRALLARVPSLLVVVRGAPAGDATATIDGRPYDLRAGSALRLDPGAHTLRVVASGHKPFERAVELPARGGVIVVEAVLEPVRATPPAQPRLETTPRGDQADRPGTVAPSGSRAPAFVAFAVGGAGLVVGAVTGVLALGKASDLEDSCPARRCATAQRAEFDGAVTLSTVSTIGFAVAGAGAGVGAVLLVLRSTSKGEARAGSGVPMSARLGVGSVGLEGAF